MRRSLLSFCASLAIMTPLSGVAWAGELKIVISGVTKTGQVFGKVFGDGESFAKRTNSVFAFVVDPRDNQAVVSVSNLPPGKYAVAVFQDVQGTGKLATDMFGMPAEPYGFSNDAKGFFGPPKFEQAAVEVGASGASITLTLR